MHKRRCGFTTSTTAVISVGESKRPATLARGHAGELCARDMRPDMSCRPSGNDCASINPTSPAAPDLHRAVDTVPQGEPVTLQVTFMGLRLGDGRMGMLCEGMLAMDKRRGGSQR